MDERSVERQTFENGGFEGGRKCQFKGLRLGLMLEPGDSCYRKGDKYKEHVFKFKNTKIIILSLVNF